MAAVPVMAVGCGDGLTRAWCSLARRSWASTRRQVGWAALAGLVMRAGGAWRRRCVSCWCRAGCHAGAMLLPRWVPCSAGAMLCWRHHAASFSPAAPAAAALRPAAGRFNRHVDTWDAVEQQGFFSLEAFIHMLSQVRVHLLVEGGMEVENNNVGGGPAVSPPNPLTTQTNPNTRSAGTGSAEAAQRQCHR